MCYTRLPEGHRQLTGIPAYIPHKLFQSGKILKKIGRILSQVRHYSWQLT